MEEYKIKEDTEITNLLCKIIEKTNANDSAIIKNLKLEKYNNSKINIGYYSGDFRNHVMGFLLSEILKLHNCLTL